MYHRFGRVVTQRTLRARASGGMRSSGVAVPAVSAAAHDIPSEHVHTLTGAAAWAPARGSASIGR
jgi:hypothetical protein